MNTALSEAQRLDTIQIMAEGLQATASDLLAIAGRMDTATQTTVAEAVKTLLPTKRPATRQKYGYALNKLVARCGDRALDDVRLHELPTWANEIRSLPGAVVVVVTDDHDVRRSTARSWGVAFGSGTVGTALRLGRRLLRPPPSTHTLVHCAHHKIGTVWWTRLFEELARLHGLRCVHVGLPEGSTLQTPGPTSVAEGDLYLYEHSRIFCRDHLTGRSFRATHMIRDPRDVAVSAYHYHLWTDEAWVHVPRGIYGGKSYQEHLASLDPADGLLLEIDWTMRHQVRDMLGWDYSQREFLELRYEDVIADEADQFARVFQHYGFDERTTARGLAIVQSISFQQMTNRRVGETAARDHLRSGRPGEWRDHFGPAHVTRFKELGGAVALMQLGYESGSDWSEV